MYIGIDIGGSNARFGLADGSENIIARHELPSGIYHGTWQTNLITGIDNLLAAAKVNITQVKAIGVGTPDLSLTFQGQKTTLRTPIKKILQDKYGLPVIVENDASVAALGELVKGAGQGKKNFLFLILGTGIGGAAVEDGKLLKGANGRAGEFGHISVEAFGPPCGCGNRGCLHLYTSGQS
ncbi:MAG: ROK family protein, partial [Candidatus Margulisbacteria bacterium]|nr:ROK family protein [Candidatus Margulisiibacteriota bacterium]